MIFSMQKIHKDGVMHLLSFGIYINLTIFLR